MIPLRVRGDLPKGCGHLNTSSVASESEALLDLDEVLVEVGCGLCLDKADARIEGRVPGHVGVGPQSQRSYPRLRASSIAASRSLRP